jgi:DnaJ-class molecular chaperone
VLGVDHTATQEEIISAFKDLSKKSQDDIGRLNELQEAFDNLTDKDMREEYDKRRVEWADDSQLIAKEKTGQGDEIYDTEEFDQDANDNHFNGSSEDEGIEDQVNEISNDIDLDNEEYESPGNEKENKEEETSDLGADGLFNFFQGEAEESKQKLKPLQCTLEATLDQIYSGITIKKKVERVRICNTCKG